MIEVKRGIKTVDLPYTIRLYGVSEDTFYEMVDEDTTAELLDGMMIVHSPATIEHDDLSGFIRTIMRLFARKRRRGKVLGPDSLIHLNGFMHEANLDEGAMWPTAFALKELTAAEKARIGALVKKAVS
jgi:hypothetical protein